MNRCSQVSPSGLGVFGTREIGGVRLEKENHGPDQDSRNQREVERSPSVQHNPSLPPNALDDHSEGEPPRVLPACCAKCDQETTPRQHTKARATKDNLPCLIKVTPFR